MGVLYFFSKKARFNYEAEAYRRQLEFNPERLDRFAEILSTKYGLGVTLDEALAALKN